LYDRRSLEIACPSTTCTGGSVDFSCFNLKCKKEKEKEKRCACKMDFLGDGPRFAMVRVHKSAERVGLEARFPWFELFSLSLSIPSQCYSPKKLS
jgi:hypothetical protein